MVVLLLHRFDHSGLPLWGSRENERASHPSSSKSSTVSNKDHESGINQYWIMICKQGCKPNWRWSDILAINAIQFPSSLCDGKVPRSHLTWVLCAAYDSTRHFLAMPLHSSRSTTVHPLSATFCGILSPSLIQPLTPSERMMLDASGKFAVRKSTASIPKHT